MSIFYPIQLLADWLTYNLLPMAHKSRLGDTVNFFIFDAIKILLLMLVVIFSVAILRTFIPPEKIRLFLSGKKSISGNFIAALFGIVTPFCTCSAIPLFLGFVEAGVPLGATFSFLISSPMINEVALVLLIGTLGLKIAIIYIVSGLIIATLSGFVVGKMKMENLLERSVLKNSASLAYINLENNWQQRTDYAVTYTLGIFKKVWIYVLIGVAMGAWIHGYVPAELLVRWAGGNSWYAVPIATLIGIPLYSNAAGVIPLVGVLTEKGVAMGTTLAFMMAVTGLSLPEFIILKRVMRVKLLFIFGAVVAVGIIFTGYLFNFVL